MSQGTELQTARVGDTFLISSAKLALRQQLRLRRAARSPAQRRDSARKAAQFALRIPALRHAQRVALYLPCGSEQSTRPLLRRLLDAGVRVFVPRLGRDGMRFVAIGPHTALRRNRHGIQEPARGPRVSARRLDVIILPLVGFDRHGYRLGSGAGHYDRALAFARRFRKPLLVGYAHACQQIDALPHESWDVPLDAVVTEQGILRWRTG